MSVRQRQLDKMPFGEDIPEPCLHSFLFRKHLLQAKIVLPLDAYPESVSIAAQHSKNPPAKSRGLASIH